MRFWCSIDDVPVAFLTQNGTALTFIDATWDGHIISLSFSRRSRFDAMPGSDPKTATKQ